MRLPVQVFEPNKCTRALAVVSIVERTECDEGVDCLWLQHILVRLEAQRGAHCDVQIVTTHQAVRRERDGK